MTAALRRRRTAATVLGIAAAGQAAVGASLPFTYAGPIWAWHRTRVATALYGADDVPAEATPMMHQLVAMLGGTIAAWGVAVAWLALGPLRRGERWAAIAIATSVLAWFPIDTGLSAVHGAWINVGFNVMAALMIAAPLALAWPRR